MNTKSKLFVITAGAAVLGVLGFGRAQAATVTKLVQRGTSADVSLGAQLPSTPGCTVEVQIIFIASTSVQRGTDGPSSGSGASGYLQLLDSCGPSEFGSFNVPLGSGFTTGSHSAVINTTFTVTTDRFDPNDDSRSSVVHTLTFSSLVVDAVDNDTTVGRQYSRFSAPGLLVIGTGRSVFRPATLPSGGVAFDGKPVLTNPTVGSVASLSTSASFNVTITKQ